MGAGQPRAAPSRLARTRDRLRRLTALTGLREAGSCYPSDQGSLCTKQGLAALRYATGAEAAKLAASWSCGPSSTASKKGILREFQTCSLSWHKLGMAKQLALPPNLAPRLISREAAAAYISLSPNTFDAMVEEGRMPRPKRLGDRRKAWDVRELDRAIDLLPHSGEEDGTASADQGWS